jgi:colanic acid/amylovoran biosynthesis protein
MNKYLIVPSNTDLNRGDQALIWESIRVIQEIDPSSEFSLICSGETEHERYLQSRQTSEMGYNFVMPLVNHPSRGEKEKNGQYYSKLQYVIWGFRAIKDLIPRLMLLSNIKLVNKIGLKLLSQDFLKTYTLLKESKAVIYKGGGFIHSYGSPSDPYVMFYLLYYAMLAKKNNVKIIIMPNSFGPFKNRLATKIIKHVLNNVDFIAVRENVSLRALDNIINKQALFFPDLGFFLKSDTEFQPDNYLKNINMPTNAIKVGITVRPYRFDGHPNPKAAYSNYIKSFTDFIQYLINQNYHPVLIAQTMGPSFNEDDNEAIKLIVSKLRNNNVSVISDSELNAKKIKKVYESMDFVVGTRFHSVIFSITSRIPSIAISYGGNKGKGIMDELELSKYEIPIEELNSDLLIKSYEALVSNKEDYIKQIDNKMVEYRNAREELKKKISNILSLTSND